MNLDLGQDVIPHINANGAVGVFDQVAAELGDIVGAATRHQDDQTIGPLALHFSLFADFEAFLTRVAPCFHEGVRMICT